MQTFQEKLHPLVGKVGRWSVEPQRYKRDQVVAFACDGEKLVGKVVVVDNRSQERSMYASDWSYDILAGNYQGSSCLFKHVPQIDVMGVVE